jgi:hypothetical protein
MATLTFAKIISNVRSDLNESGTTGLSDAELRLIVKDGLKDTAVKGLCYEQKIAKTDIPARKIVSLVGSGVLRVNYVEYKSGTTQGGAGLMAVLPSTFGHTNLDGTSPQYWFQWGEYIMLDPTPDVAAYDLEVYAACYPTSIASGSLVVGTTYVIDLVGTTTWATAGAAAETLGTEFVASATSAGTGTAVTMSQLPVEFHECVYLFTLAFAALKLKRWGDAANAYNKYIIDVQRKRNEYIMKYPESRLALELPSNVTMEAKSER